MKSASAEAQKQYIRVPCDCKGGGYVLHYDKLRCKCGHIWWALRPRRHGPLVAYLWPGDWRSGPLPSISNLKSQI